MAEEADPPALLVAPDLAGEDPGLRRVSLDRDFANCDLGAGEWRSSSWQFDV
jgi:hypothetical protein